jgi:hypothetical protein
MKYPRAMFRFLLGLIVLLSTPALLGASGQPEGDMNLWGLIKQGGWAMYPLRLSSIVMLFLILHAVRETTQSRFVPDG